ncbi:hypothetical protein SCOCK_90003 [Actinacidiphila cocklensis]|uniref:Uncharacterized protein n=1 Tax=Actinacidiphila cocklensis TaxID=887465 RepID=A0A9W4DZZ5_9ACTN|nr:hypothetical protein SCOCK_90003 [Actinacidiphila cocklensis]
MLRNIPGSRSSRSSERCPPSGSPSVSGRAGATGPAARVDGLVTGAGATPAAAALLGSLFALLGYALRDDAPVPFVASSAYTQRSLEQA